MKQILHGVNSSNTFKSDHSRLGLVKNKFLENIQIGRIFCAWRQVYFTKFCPKIWWRVNLSLLYFLYIRFEVKQYYEALFLSYRSRTEPSTQFSKTNITLSFNIQDDRSTGTCGLLAIQCVKKIQTVLLFHRRQICILRCCVWMNIITLMLQHDIVYFLSHSFITMCNLKKRLIRVTFWVLLQAMFMNVWKQTAQRLKLQDLSKRD